MTRSNEMYIYIANNEIKSPSAEYIQKSTKITMTKYDTEHTRTKNKLHYSNPAHSKHGEVMKKTKQ